MPDEIWNSHDYYVYGLAQDGSNTSSLAVELLQSCAEPLLMSD